MKKGFSLVELLVVISIVTILIAVGISVFSSVQKANRDQQRLRDLNTIKQALELYRSDNGSYPASLPDLNPKYLDSVPSDPSVGRSYQMQKSGTTFLLCAKKEGINTFNLADECQYTNLSCGGSDGDCDMGVASI